MGWLCNWLDASVAIENCKREGGKRKGRRSCKQERGRNVRSREFSQTRCWGGRIENKEGDSGRRGGFGFAPRRHSKLKWPSKFSFIYSLSQNGKLTSLL